MNYYLDINHVTGERYVTIDYRGHTKQFGGAMPRMLNYVRSWRNSYLVAVGVYQLGIRDFTISFGGVLSVSLQGDNLSDLIAEHYLSCFATSNCECEMDFLVRELKQDVNLRK